MYHYLNEVADDGILKQKEKKLGFKSLYSICLEAFSEDEKLWDSYENLSYSKEKFLGAIENGTLASYSQATLDLIEQGKLKFETFEGEKLVNYNTCAPYLVRILNENNLVCINDTIFQYQNHEIKFIPDGNFNLISELDNTTGNEEYKGIIVAKERKEKSYYYPTNYVKWPSPTLTNQSGTSWNSRKIAGYLAIKHFDYIASNEGNAPWYYASFYIQAYTWVHRFWKWRYDSDKIYLSSFEWYRDLTWVGHFSSRESFFPISAEMTTNKSAGGTYLMMERWDNPDNIRDVWFWANVVLSRDANTDVSIHLQGDAHEVTSRWW